MSVFSDLADNQMVTFTDASTGGFTLQSSQSHITSNQCMTKNDAQVKYILNSSAMSSYSNNQLVPKSAWVSGVIYTHYLGSGYLNSSGACGEEVFPEIPVYTSGTIGDSGTILYTDSVLMTPYNGNNYYYKLDTPNGIVVRINTIGEVIENLSCNTVTSYPYSIDPNGFSNSPASCSNTFESTLTLYSDSSYLSSGMILYEDSSLTSFFNGGDLYYQSGDIYYTLKINNVGEVIELVNCSPTVYPWTLGNYYFVSAQDACYFDTEPDSFAAETITNPPEIGDIVWSYQGNDTRWNGNNQWFHFRDINVSYQIDANGIIINKYTC